MRLRSVARPLALCPLVLSPPVSAGESFFLTLRPKPRPVTAVMLSIARI